MALFIRRAGTPEYSVDPRNQLARGKRLGHVIVGAGFQPGDLVVLGDPRGQHDDGNVCGQRFASQPACQLDTADPGHHPVQQDDIRPLCADGGQRFACARRAGDFHARPAQ